MKEDNVENIGLELLKIHFLNVRFQINNGNLNGFWFEHMIYYTTT